MFQNIIAMNEPFPVIISYSFIRLFTTHQLIIDLIQTDQIRFKWQTPPTLTVKINCLTSCVGIVV